MEKIIAVLRRFSIRQRLFVFILIPLILMIICFLFYYSYSRNVLFEKSAQISKQRMTMAENSLSLNALHLEESFDEFCSTTAKNTLLGSTQASFQEEAEKQLDILGAKTILLYQEQGALLYQAGAALALDAHAYPIEQNGFDWFYEQDSQSVILGEQLYSRGVKIGRVYALFPQEAFAPSFLASASDDMALVVTDDQQRVLFGQGTLTPGVQLQIENGKTLIGLHTYFVQSSKITHTNWNVVDLVSQDYVYEEIINIRNMLLLYSFISLIILFLFSSLFYHSIHDPIQALLISMRNFNESDLDKILLKDRGRDEIHDLNENFNELVVRIDELLKTVQQEQEQRRETQFQLLQAQINPHFLFNTLNTLRYLAILNEDKPVSEGISALSRLLRNTIVDSNEMVSIQEEIENVKSYIIIQKLRYGDIFETVYNIDEQVSYRRILKFLLQPIVENSILHAFAEDREHQILTIRVSSSKGFLKIEIGDNGKGFQMAEEKSNKKLSGIGMKNIQDRIKLMYGGTYRMEVNSVVGVGTITTLYLPLQ